MSAWDEINDRIEVASRSQVAPDHAWESELHPLLEQAMADHSVDRELHIEPTARWIAALVAVFHFRRQQVRTENPVDLESDLIQLKMIVTRWLHPARPR